jgi:endonuclease YncB( thermonuclease family)
MRALLYFIIGILLGLICIFFDGSAVMARSTNTDCLRNGASTVCQSLDRYGRTVAICRADGRDLGADMVADGHAWAFVRYSRDYVEEEREAATVRAGIHGHTCKPAWRGAPSGDKPDHAK